MNCRLFSFHFVVAFLFAAQMPAQAPAAVPVQKAAADAHPSLVVATVKPHDPNSQHQGINARGDRFTVLNQSVASMMLFAYAIHPKQIIDAPDWMLHDRWDIEAKIDTPAEPSLRQMQEMMQRLLADRFQLHFTREKRELPVYAIRVAKGGPKLTPAAHPDHEADQTANGHGTDLTQIYTSATIADFILGMQFFVPDRPMVDQTGLTGRYDIRLRYTPDESRTTDPNAPPGLFTAIQQQLGLKLEPVKVPIDVFKIDHVERPGEN